MSRLCHADDLQQRAYKAQSALNGLALMVYDPGRHAVKHLKQQIAAVNKQELFHKVTSFAGNFYAK